jgi:MFS family permease
MSLMQALYSVAGVVGPGIAGLMVSNLGYVTPMLTNAATFVVLGVFDVAIRSFIFGDLHSTQFTYDLVTSVFADGSTLTAYASALVIQRAPKASRARVISALQAVTSIASLVALAIAGAVVSLIDPRIAIILSGALCLLVVGVLAPTLRRPSRPAADI